MAPTGHISEARSILFIVNAAWFFLSHRLPIARAARAAGYDVHLVADVATTEELSLLTQEGLIVHHVSLARGGLNPLSDLRFLLRTLTIMRKVSPRRRAFWA